MASEAGRVVYLGPRHRCRNGGRFYSGFDSGSRGLVFLACHGAGIGSAPIFGDVAAWGPRVAKGIETLNEHALDGFTDVGYMPPKGGRIDLSDAEILDAVAYMVAEVQ